MDLFDVNVKVAGGNGGYLGSPLELTIQASGDEVFMAAVERGVRAQVGDQFGHREGRKLMGLVWQDPEYPEMLHQLVPDELTVAQVAAYFETEIHAWPPTINVDDGGYGGGSTYVPYLINVYNTVTTVGTVVGATLATQRVAVRARYHLFRQLAKEWNDTGVISTELSDAVYNGFTWDRKTFDRVFALGDSRGPELLRALGAERKFDAWGSEYWIYDFERSGGSDA